MSNHMNRRAFLRIAGGALTGAALPVRAGAAGQRRMKYPLDLV